MQNIDFDSDCIGNVIRITDASTILINVGRNNLSSGTKIQVYEPVEMITDIDGNKLGFYNYIKDTLEVIQVQENFSICQKKELVEHSMAVALSPLLEKAAGKKVYENAPLNIDKNDIQAFPPADPLIRIGDPVKLA